MGDVRELSGAVWFWPFAAMLSGVCGALSVSGLDMFWLAWVALVPLLLVVCGAGARRAIAAGLVAGAIETAVLWRWLPGTTAFMAQAPAIGVVLLAVLCLYRLHLHPRGAGSAEIRVAILQPNIPPFEKYDKAKSDLLAQRHFGLARQAVAADPDLIVWSEAAIPWPLEDDDDLVSAMLTMTREAKACHVLGGMVESRDSPGRYNNAAFLVLPDGRLVSQYDKRKLLLFAESPVKLPFLSRRSILLPTDRRYLAGTAPGVFPAPFGRIGITICNENLYPSLVRETVREGADFVVTLANDGWFSAPMVRRQHCAVVVARAIETGRTMVVANNSGISCIVDGLGRIHGRTPIDDEVCLSGVVYRGTGRTYYVRWGDAFCWLCLAAVIFAVPGGIWRSVRVQRSVRGISGCSGDGHSRLRE